MTTDRLLLWSAGCLPGVHLPLFAAEAEGMAVELVESAPGSERVRLLAEGQGDFLLTATLYHLQALAEAGPAGLAVRAAAVVHQRSPVAAIVAADSPLRTPADLVGRRLGMPVGEQMGWLGVELMAALPGAVDVVGLSYPDAFAALARGEIDFVANFEELLPIDRRRAGVDLRAIPAGADIYTSSLLVGGGVAPDRAERAVAALRASFELQRDEPSRGASELCARYPSISVTEAIESWLALEPFVFGAAGGPLGPGDAAGWARTLAWASATHHLGPLSTESVLRTDGALAAR